MKAKNRKIIYFHYEQLQKQKGFNVVCGNYQIEVSAAQTLQIPYIIEFDAVILS